MMDHERIAPTEVTGPLGALISFGARRMMGRVPRSVGVLWHNKAVMKDAMGIGRKVEGWHELDATLAAFAAMASAAAIGCSFCLDLNYFMAHNRGLDEAKVREVPRWREATVFTPLERRVMEYADAASQTPPTVTDDLSDALLAELGESALVELAARVAFMNMSARMNVVLGIHSEEFAESCGLPPLAQRSAAPDSSSAAESGVRSGAA